jgi:hypothetical protein
MVVWKKLELHTFCMLTYWFRFNIFHVGAVPVDACFVPSIRLPHLRRPTPLSLSR